MDTITDPSWTFFNFVSVVGLTSFLLYLSLARRVETAPPRHPPHPSVPITDVALLVPWSTSVSLEEDFQLLVLLVIAFSDHHCASLVAPLAPSYCPNRLL